MMATLPEDVLNQLPQEVQQELAAALTTNDVAVPLAWPSRSVLARHWKS